MFPAAAQRALLQNACAHPTLMVCRYASGEYCGQSRYDRTGDLLALRAVACTVDSPGTTAQASFSHCVQSPASAQASFSQYVQSPERLGAEELHRFMSEKKISLMIYLLIYIVRSHFRRLGSFAHTLCWLKRGKGFSDYSRERASRRWFVRLPRHVTSQPHEVPVPRAQGFGARQLQREVVRPLARWFIAPWLCGLQGPGTKQGLGC